MTTNIDRAKTIVEDLIDEPWAYKDGGLASAVVGEFHAEGLLMPDLPVPTFWDRRFSPTWQACETDVYPADDAERIEMANAEHSWVADAEDIESLAYAMLAAVRYMKGDR